MNIPKPHLIAKDTRSANIVGLSRPWTLFCEEIQDDDFAKYHHFAIHEDTGDTLHIRFSSFQKMTVTDLDRWLDLGCPNSLPHMAKNMTFTGRDLELAWFREVAKPNSKIAVMFDKPKFKIPRSVWIAMAVSYALLGLAFWALT
jgi:hypothetical protein